MQNLLARPHNTKTRWYLPILAINSFKQKILFTQQVTSFLNSLSRQAVKAKDVPQLKKGLDKLLDNRSINGYLYISSNTLNTKPVKIGEVGRKVDLKKNFLSTCQTQCCASWNAEAVLMLFIFQVDSAFPHKTPLMEDRR